MSDKIVRDNIAELEDANRAETVSSAGAVERPRAPIA